MATDGPILAEAALIPRMVGDGPGAATGRDPSDLALFPDRRSLDLRRPYGKLRSVPR